MFSLCQPLARPRLGCPRVVPLVSLFSMPIVVGTDHHRYGRKEFFFFFSYKPVFELQNPNHDLDQATPRYCTPPSVNGVLHITLIYSWDGTRWGAPSDVRVYPLQVRDLNVYSFDTADAGRPLTLVIFRRDCACLFQCQILTTR